MQQALARALEGIKTENKKLRRLIIASTLTVVLTVLGLFIGFVQISQSTIAEQNAWLRQSIERIESASTLQSPDQQKE
ncbi:hypothetical protein [Oceanimonas smirnovii]|uniref:hypothetical protein n=1 Tax=Oceanimonas smirnovii TaxID=264574 RepID=UPI003FD5CDFB